jgi:hypothetical protein
VARENKEGGIARRLSGALILLLLGFPAAALAQGTTIGRFGVHSCALLDSLLGRKGGGEVVVWHNPTTPTYIIRSGSYQQMEGVVSRKGIAPQPYPAPDLFMMIPGPTAARLLAPRTLPPMVELILDDSLRVPVGPGEVRKYTGPPSMAIAPLSVLLAPNVALQLARAKKVAVVVDSTVHRIRKSDLQSYVAVYRFAVCDSLPRGW